MLALEPTLAEPVLSETGSLLAQARAGDAEALGELCRAYETPLLRQAFALCRRESLAEDLAQDTLVEAWQGLHRYNGRCRFFTWLCAILINRYRNTLRRKSLLPFFAWTRPDDDPRSLAGSVPANDASPDQAAQSREQAELLRQCIASLPLKHQQVIHLRFYVDDSLEGIAAALGCSVGTVKSRLFHALEKLRAMNALRDQCLFTRKGERPREP